MSYMTFAGRRFLGDERYEEVKGAALGTGAAALISALPADKGGAPPRAIVEHKITNDQWQKVAVGAAVFLTAFYFFLRR